MNFLFICTHNRCRSILAEAITNHLAAGRIRASSAGSEPAGEVHPLTLRYLRERGIATEGLRSKSWEALEGPAPDVVLTVCDSAANEACPLWLGASPKVHWGLPDPSKVRGSEEAVRAAFVAVMDTLEFRIRKLLMMKPESLTPAQLQEALQAMAGEN